MKLHLQINCFLIMFLGISTNETFTPNSEHLEKQETFCGDNLTKAMAKFCISVPSPNYRTRRAISSECCHRPCSLKYLLRHYCQEVNRTAIEFHIKQQTDVRSAIVATAAEPAVEQQIKSPLFHAKRRFRGKKRGKRNCICDKRKIENIRERNAIAKWRTKLAVPEAKVGVIEGNSRPFYVRNKFQY